MASLLDLAKMSSAVYDDDENLGRGVVSNGWTCLRFRAASGSLSGFQGAIFRKSGETVVAFRGTAQAMDVVADLKLGSGMNSTYFDLGQRFASFAPGSNVIVTGHSLGGAIAQVVANRGGYAMATFNAPGVGVVASRNIQDSNLLMNMIRVPSMVIGAIRHPQQAASDVANVFRFVQGINICLANDRVSRIGNHYGRVRRIPGTSRSPVTEHRIGTLISVLEQPRNAALARRSPGSF